MATVQSHTIKQGDTGPPLIATLKGRDGVAQNLTGASVKLNVVGVMTLDHATCTILDAVNGKVQYDWQSANTTAVGKSRGEFEVTLVDGTIVTFPNDSFFEINIVAQLK